MDLAYVTNSIGDCVRVPIGALFAAVPANMIRVGDGEVSQRGDLLAKSDDRYG